MEHKIFVLEVLLGAETEVFMLRDERGKVVKSTTDANEFLEFLRNGETENEDEEGNEEKAN